MIQLPNNCRCSGTPGDPDRGTPDILSVYPKNWKTVKASTAKDWYISFYFYDPRFADKYPRGKFVIRKSGINHFKLPAERQHAVRIIMAKLLQVMKDECYNFITEERRPATESKYDISDKEPFLNCLAKALQFLKCTPDHFKEVERTLKYFGKSAEMIKLDHLKLCEVKKMHILSILDNCANLPPIVCNKKERKIAWNANQFNKYRTNIVSLFSRLVSLEIIETNPAQKVEKEISVKKIRSIPDQEELKSINSHLLENDYFFWRITMIYTHGSARRTELMNLKKEDVELSRQRFKVLVKKGKQYKEEWRVIIDKVLPLWQEVMSSSNNGDFLFGKGMIPGPVGLHPRNLHDRWHRLVKRDMKIDKDFRSLRNSYFDLLADWNGIKKAQEAGGHTSEKTTRIYTLGQAQREADNLRNAPALFEIIKKPA